MRRLFAVVLASLLLSPLILAQEKPDTPKPHVGKTFYIELTALAVAETADAVSTRRLLDAGGHENNALLLGRRPSPAKQAAVSAALFAGQVAIFRLTERNRHAWVRWTCRIVLGAEIVVHSQLAACNFGVGPGRSCPAL